MSCGNNNLDIKMDQFSNNQLASSESMCTEEAANPVEQEAACTSVADLNQARGIDESEIRISMSRCVLCTKQLVADDDAKLLECLHPTCTSCIETKLAGPSEISEHSCKYDCLHCFLIKFKL